MASIITTEITSQRFELIRTQVGAIITEELAAQYGIVAPVNPLLNATVWKERFIPFDKTELPAINVRFSKSGFSEKNPKNSTGDCEIFVDVLTKGKHTNIEQGDTKSLLDNEKLLGIIRYILEYPGWWRLGFPVSPAFIKSTSVDSLQVFGSQNVSDGIHTVAGQLVFSAKYYENNGDLTGVPLEVATMEAKLVETELGFKYEIN